MVFSHITSLITAIACIGWWQGMEVMLETFAYRTVTVVYFTDQNWISKTVYCISCVMVCKIGFTNWNAKIAILRASMVVTYYIQHFRTVADRHNGILMSPLILVAETIICMIIDIGGLWISEVHVFFIRKLFIRKWAPKTPKP